MSDSENNWKTKIIITFALIGAVVGVVTGYLFSRTAEDSGGQAPKINTTDALKSAIGIIGVVRGIASLGGRE